MREKKPGFCVITYKFRVYTNHEEYLKLTKDVYNKEILKYYHLLLEHIDILNLSNMDALRQLEIINKEEISKNENLSEDFKLPAYLRRSAINHAIGSMRSYISRVKQAEEKNSEIEDKAKAIKVNQAKFFNVSPVYYKGMYRNLTQSGIELKLFNGEKWAWYRVKIKSDDRKFNPEDALSPRLIIENKFAMIHIPVRQEIDDVSSIKERLEYKKAEDVRVLSLCFSNNDNFVTCTVMDRNGRFVKSLFIKGGDDYKARTSTILNKIKRDRRLNKYKLAERDHKNYWNKLYNIGETLAHQTSRKILEFAKENNAEVIILPEVVDGDEYVARKIGKYSPYYLRHRIVSYLEYKSFKESILITKVRSNYTASRCYKCRAKVRKESNQMAECENGHRYNYFFNTSMNVGIFGLKKYGYLND